MILRRHLTQKALVFFLIVAIFLATCLSLPVTAQDHLNDIISGFDEQEQSPSNDTGVNEVIEGSDESTGKKADELDKVMDGFDQPSGDAEEKDEHGLRASLPEWLEITGSLGMSSSINLLSHRAPPWKINAHGLSRLRTRADLQADFKLPSSWRLRMAGHIFYDWAYLILDRDNFTDDVLDENEKEVELGEAYIQGRLRPDLDIKFGRQIVVWGTSELLRVTDVLNPLDQREPGMVDIEDLRLPVTMTKLDYYLNNRWGITGLTIHEVRFNKEPPFGSDFSPSTVPLPYEDIPEFSFKNHEFTMALTGRLTGWDLSFHGAWLFNDNSHIENAGQRALIQKHSRLAMFGGTVQIARGNWLIKAETALLKGLEFSNLPAQKKSRIDILAGVEYSGFRETTITLEAVNRHLLGYDEGLMISPDEKRENEFQSVLRINRDFYNDTLHLAFLVSAFGIRARDGSFERAQIEYDWTDNISITFGAIFYQRGEKTFFKAIKDNDRMFLEFKYSF